jgi:uncharacterized damage-inducible protein DinB
MASSLQTLRGLLAYTIWADRQVLSALAEVPEEDLVRETGVSFGSVLGTMAHILGAEQLWLSRFLGVPMGGAPTVEDFWPQLEVFLASLTEEQLGADFTWTNSRGETNTVPFRKAVLHFVNHSTYHRGQVVAQLAQLGRRPPSTDLVYWHGDA